MSQPFLKGLLRIPLYFQLFIPNLLTPHPFFHKVQSSSCALFIGHSTSFNSFTSWTFSHHPETDSHVSTQKRKSTSTSFGMYIVTSQNIEKGFLLPLSNVIVKKDDTYPEFYLWPSLIKKVHFLPLWNWIHNHHFYISSSNYTVNKSSFWTVLNSTKRTHKILRSFIHHNCYWRPKVRATSLTIRSLYLVQLWDVILHCLIDFSYCCSDCPMSSWRKLKEFRQLPRF